ncbi:MAG: hypothetical protein HUU55_12890 [Myxococcales bacterium]|nr:hypothetical protein [Myxococcales bacterium]
MTRCGSWFGSLAGLVFLLSGASCERDIDSGGPLPQLDREWVPQLTGTNDPNWSPKSPAANSAQDPVVAQVGETKIYLSALQRQVDLDGGQTPVADILERMIEFEVLAQEAFGRGFHHDVSVVEAIRQAAVQRYLSTKFTQEHGPHMIREEDYQKAYNFPGIRIRFDHFDLYFTIDVQIACCHGSVQDCKLSTKAQQCFDEKTPIIQSVYEALIRKSPFKDEAEFQRAAEEIRSLYPDIGIKKLDFWYKQGIPYEQQRGFTKLNTDLVEAVVAAPMYEVLPPVRSNHAWHIEYKYKHVPEEHRTLDDPGVREEIAANIYPQIRARDYADYVGKLFKEYRVERDYDKLKHFEPGHDETAAQNSVSESNAE